MRYLWAAVVWLSLLFCFMSVIGEPDVLDGIIRWANSQACDSEIER